MDNWNETDPFSSNSFNSFEYQNNSNYYSNNQNPVVSYPQITPPPPYSQATSQNPNAYPVPPTTPPPTITQRLTTALAITSPAATNKTPQSQAPIPELSPEKNESELVDFYHYSQSKDLFDFSDNLQSDRTNKADWPAILIMCEDKEQSYALPAVLVKNLNIPTAYLTSKERPAKDYRKYNALIIRSLELTLSTS